MAMVDLARARLGALASRVDFRVCDFLDRLEANEGDQPLTLLEDLEILRSSGLRSASALWLEYRELVSGGQK